MRLRFILSVFVIVAGCALGWLAANAQDTTARRKDSGKVDRNILPPPPAEFRGKIGPNYKESPPDFSPAVPVMRWSCALVCGLRALVTVKP
mgnify:CR=1 FL=1